MGYTIILAPHLTLPSTFMYNLHTILYHFPDPLLYYINYGAIYKPYGAFFDFIIYRPFF